MLSALALGCAQGALPVERVQRPPDGDASCEEACAHVTQLGCSIGGPKCVQRCTIIPEIQGDYGQVVDLHTGCWLNAKSCQELRLC